MNVQLKFSPSRESAAGQRALLFFLVIAVLGVWLPYTLLGDPRYRSYHMDREFWLAIGILEFCTLRLAWLAAAGRPHLLAMTFYLFLYIWAGLVGSIQIYKWRWSWGLRHTPEDILPALTMIAVALLAYELGRLLSRGRLRPPQGPPAPVRILNVSPNRVLLLTVLAVPAAIYGTYYFGGIENLFATRATFVGLEQKGDKMGTLLARALLRTPSFVALVLAAYYSRKNWTVMKRPQKRLFLALLAFLLALNVGTNYPAAQARYWLGTIVLTPLFAFVPWRRAYMAGWILFMTVSLLYVYPRADIFRKAPTFSAAFELLKQEGSVTNNFFTGDYDVFQQTVNSVVYTEREGIMWGRNLSGAALFWFPRAYWKSKPKGTGHYIAFGVRYTYLNLSAPLWVEAFIAYSWPGVVLLMGLYGFLSGRGDRAFIRTVRSGSFGSVAGIAIPFWAAFQFFLLRGDLQNSCAHSLFAAALFWWATRGRFVGAFAPEPEKQAAESPDRNPLTDTKGYRAAA